MEFANKAVISLSGGLDSTCLLLHLLANGVEEVHCYSFDYGQKHDIELKKAKKNIKFLQKKGFNVTFQVINLRDVWSDSASSLHKGGTDIPKGTYDTENQKSTVIDGRNVLFGQIAAIKALSWANRTESNVYVTLGVHANDTSTYPDTRPESIAMSQELFRISNWNTERVEFIAPFQYFTKSEVLRDGIESMNKLGFTKVQIKNVLKNTHSCYDPNEKGESCGLCGTCRERLQAFGDNGMEDPITYSNTPLERYVISQENN